jgi:hypothetical protein
MNNNSNNENNPFEYQEYYILHNSSILKFIIIKTNQEIIIKSNNYEVKLNHKIIEDLLETKFDTIEKEYKYFRDLFQLNLIMVKELILDKTMILFFNHNNKRKEIILFYNNNSKSIIHYEINYEFKNMMNDIAQIKNDVRDIRQAINQNKILENKNNDLDLNFQESQFFKKFLVNHAILMLEEGIKKKEKEINETEKKINDYQNSAKETLKKEIK